MAVLTDPKQGAIAHISAYTLARKRDLRSALLLSKTQIMAVKSEQQFPDLCGKKH